MSANIAIGKLKFTVFGKGYDDERGNSGSGVKEGEVLNYGSRYAEIDATGRYIWVAGDFGIRKIDTFTWEEVSMGDIPNWMHYINHPKNVSNNYGFVSEISGYGADMTGYIFDLTTNEIISSGDLTYRSGGGQDDCILVDDVLIFASLTQGRASNYVTTLAIDDFTMTRTEGIGRSFVGFTDNSHIYGYYPKEWFYQDSNISLITTSGVWVWDVQRSNFNNVAVGGLTRNGKIYVPSSIDGNWVLGEYPQTPAPDFDTPTPSRYFGVFNGYPNTVYNGVINVKYSTLRDIALICTSDTGIYMTDFEDVYRISDTNTTSALAINDEMAVIYNGSTRKTEVIMF